jgi:hypothetical protein
MGRRKGKSTKNRHTIHLKNPIGRLFYDIPIEIWCSILHYAVISPLFPYSEQDPDNDLLSLSILHEPYLFLVYWSPLPSSMQYLNHEIYTSCQLVLAQLRRVCRLWNQIMKRHIIPRYQWMFLDNQGSHSPRGLMINPQQPCLLVVTEYGQSRPSLVYSDYDLSRVKIVVLEHVSMTRSLVEALSSIPSLRALSFGSDNPALLSQLLGTPSVMKNLTHLHIFHIKYSDFVDFKNKPPLCFPNLRYLALHFKLYHFIDGRRTNNLFPKWKLERLTCLSIAVANMLPGNDEALGIFFERLLSSGTNMVSELLLDFRQQNIKSSFWERVWTVWFPHLAVLGCPAQCIADVASSLLWISTATPLQNPPSLFILDQDTNRSTPQCRDLGEIYRVGHLKRIIVPSSDYYSSFVESLVDYCSEQKIPVYDTEGWQVHKVSGPPSNIFASPLISI